MKKSCFNDNVDSRPGNFLKTQSYRVKIMIYVAYMLKIISLTGTPQSHEFKKIASCVVDPAEYLLFVYKIVLVFGF